MTLLQEERPAGADHQRVAGAIDRPGDHAADDRVLISHVADLLPPQYRGVYGRDIEEQQRDVLRRTS